MIYQKQKEMLDMRQDIWKFKHSTDIDNFCSEQNFLTGHKQNMILFHISNIQKYPMIYFGLKSVSRVNLASTLLIVRTFNFT